jgi:hypothetical protein
MDLAPKPFSRKSSQPVASLRDALGFADRFRGSTITRLILMTRVGVEAPLSVEKTAFPSIR